MTPERWQQIDQLFHAALACQPEERAEFLATQCAGDENLRSEVESLISSLEEADDFIETPAGDVAAEVLGTHQSAFQPDQEIANYRIVNQLGSGGMGEVYLAEDIRLKRHVALKILPPHFTVNPDRVRRFEREARAASALNHPNIVTIYEIGHSDSTHFIATEFVDGKTLRQLIYEKPFTLNETLNVSIQIADALSGAHAAGIVHRDIKPENIMIRRDGYVKILDFGLAKLTEQQTNDSDLETPTLLQSNPGLVMGTVQYMSPEQARAKHVGVGTDIWSLGIVMYELLAGHVPFTGETPSHVMVSLMEDRLPPLKDHANVPDELDRFVTKTLRKSQKDRYQAAGQLARDLKEFKQKLQRDAQLSHWLKTVPSSKDGTQLLLTGSTTVTGPHPIRVEQATAAKTTPDLSHPTSSARYLVNEIKDHRRTLAFVAIAMLIAVMGVYFYISRKTNVASTNEAIDSVAVLPFANLNSDPNTDYLSDGITDNIINILSRLPELKVMSFSSVLRYKGKQIDPQGVGKELKVRAVLMGRMIQRGDDLSISVELVDVRDNRRLWGDQYNRKLSEVISVQTEIAKQISGGLRLRLTSEDRRQLSRNYTQDTEAYRRYSLGMYSMRENTKEAMEKAIEYFEAAVDYDPSYTLAYTGLYRAYYGLGQMAYRLPKDSRQKMEWAALKAVELDDSSVEAHLELATVRKVNWEWASAEKEYKRALELDPNSVHPYFSYAAFLMDVGRPDEAMIYARRAEELDHDHKGPAVVAMVHLYKGEYDQAIELYLKRPNSDSFQLAEAYTAKGMYKEALEQVQKSLPDDHSPEPWQGYPRLASAYARAGQRDDALKILREEQRAAKERYISPFNFAIIYTGLGDNDRAFEYLNKAYEAHVLNLSHFVYGPFFESLHSDPRYKDLLKRMNLAS